MSLNWTKNVDVADAGQVQNNVLPKVNAGQVFTPKLNLGSVQPQTVTATPTVKAEAPKKRGSSVTMGGASVTDLVKQPTERDSLGKVASVAGKNLVAGIAVDAPETLLDVPDYQKVKTYVGGKRQAKQTERQKSKTNLGGHTTKNRRKEAYAQAAKEFDNLIEETNQHMNDTHIVPEKMRNWADARQAEADSLKGSAGKFLANLARSSGTMAATMAVGGAVGGVGGAMAASAAAMPTMGSMVATQTYKEDVARGMSPEKAVSHAEMNAAIEVGSELLFAEMPGMGKVATAPLLRKAGKEAVARSVSALEKKGVVQALTKTGGAKFAANFAGNVGAKTAQITETEVGKFLSDTLKDFASSKAGKVVGALSEEGLEEVIAEELQPYADRAVGLDADNATIGDLMLAFIGGVIMCGTAKGAVSASHYLAGKAATLGVEKVESVAEGATTPVAPIAQAVRETQPTSEETVSVEAPAQNGATAEGLRALEAEGVTPQQVIQFINDEAVLHLENTDNTALQEALKDYDFSGIYLENGVLPHIDIQNATWEDAAEYAETVYAKAKEFTDRMTQIAFGGDVAEAVRRDYSGVYPNLPMNPLFMKGAAGGYDQVSREKAAADLDAKLGTVNDTLVTTLSEIAQKEARGELSETEAAKARSVAEKKAQRNREKAYNKYTTPEGRAINAYVNGEFDKWYPEAQTIEDNIAALTIRAAWENGTLINIEGRPGVYHTLFDVFEIIANSDNPDSYITWSSAGPEYDTMKKQAITVYAQLVMEGGFAKKAEQAINDVVANLRALGISDIDVKRFLASQLSQNSLVIGITDRNAAKIRLNPNHAFEYELAVNTLSHELIHCIKDPETRKTFVGIVNDLAERTMLDYDTYAARFAKAVRSKEENRLADDLSNGALVKEETAAYFMNRLFANRDILEAAHAEDPDAVEGLAEYLKSITDQTAYLNDIGRIQNAIATEVITLLKRGPIAENVSPDELFEMSLGTEMLEADTAELEQGFNIDYILELAKPMREAFEAEQQRAKATADRVAENAEEPEEQVPVNIIPPKSKPKKKKTMAETVVGIAGAADSPKLNMVLSILGVENSTTDLDSAEVVLINDTDGTQAALAAAMTENGVPCVYINDKNKTRVNAAAKKDARFKPLIEAFSSMKKSAPQKPDVTVEADEGETMVEVSVNTLPGYNAMDEVDGIVRPVETAQPTNPGKIKVGTPQQLRMSLADFLTMSKVNAFDRAVEAAIRKVTPKAVSQNRKAYQEVMQELGYDRNISVAGAAMKVGKAMRLKKDQSMKFYKTLIDNLDFGELVSVEMHPMFDNSRIAIFGPKGFASADYLKQKIRAYAGDNPIINLPKQNGELFNLTKEYALSVPLRLQTFGLAQGMKGATTDQMDAVLSQSDAVFILTDETPEKKDGRARDLTRMAREKGLAVYYFNYKTGEESMFEWTKVPGENAKTKSIVKEKQQKIAEAEQKLSEETDQENISKLQKQIEAMKNSLYKRNSKGENEIVYVYTPFDSKRFKSIMMFGKTGKPKPGVDPLRAMVDKLVGPKAVVVDSNKAKLGKGTDPTTVLIVTEQGDTAARDMYTKYVKGLGAKAITYNATTRTLSTYDPSTKKFVKQTFDLLDDYGTGEDATPQIPEIIDEIKATAAEIASLKAALNETPGRKAEATKTVAKAAKEANKTEGIIEPKKKQYAYDEAGEPIMVNGHHATTAELKRLEGKRKKAAANTNEQKAKMREGRGKIAVFLPTGNTRYSNADVKDEIRARIMKDHKLKKADDVTIIVGMNEKLARPGDVMFDVWNGDPMALAQYQEASNKGLTVILTNGEHELIIPAYSLAKAAAPKAKPEQPKPKTPVVSEVFVEKKAPKKAESAPAPRRIMAVDYAVGDNADEFFDVLIEAVNATTTRLSVEDEVDMGYIVEEAFDECAENTTVKEIAELICNKFGITGAEAETIANDVEDNLTATVAKDDAELYQLSTGVITDDDVLGEGDFDINELYNWWVAQGEQHGTMPPSSGAEPSRAGAVPKATDAGKVSQFMRNLYEAPNFSDEMAEVAMQALHEGIGTYIPMSNDETMAKAHHRLENSKNAVLGVNAEGETVYDIASEIERYIQQHPNGTTDVGDIAYAELLLSEIDNAGQLGVKDKDGVPIAEKLIANLRNSATRSGQATQAFAMLRKMTPMGRVYSAVSAVESVKESILNDKRWAKEVKKGRMQALKNYHIPEELVDELKKAQTPAEVDAAYEKIIASVSALVPPTVEDRFRAWRYLSMLGNFRTHIRNMSSNAIMFIEGGIAGKMNDIAEDVFLSKSDNRTTTAKLIAPEIKDFAKRDYEIMKNELVNDTKLEFANQIDEARRKFSDKPWGRVLEYLSRKNLAALEWEDGVFLRYNYKRALAKYIAANGGLDNFTGSDRASLKRLAEARAHAILKAQKATYRDPSDVARRLSSWERKNMASRIFFSGIIPFKKTPINIVRRAVEYSPIGLAIGSGKAIANTAAGSSYTANEIITDMCQGLTGSAIMFLGYWLTGMGFLKAGGSGDKREEYYDEMLGNQRYSITLFGDNYTLDWATPSVVALMAGAELCQRFAAHEDEDEDDDLGFWTKMTDMTGSILHTLDPLTQLSVLQGVNDALTTYNYEGVGGSVGNVLSSALTNWAGQYIPTMSGQLRRVADPVRRVTYAPKDVDFPGGQTVAKFANKLANKSIIAGLAQSGTGNEPEPYVDQWGRQQLSADSIPQRVFEQMVAPWYRRAVEKTKVDDEIARLYEQTGESSIFPSTLDSKETFSKQDYYYTEKEETKYKTLVGETRYECMADLVDTPDYYRLSDADKVDTIKDVYKYANALAKKDFAYMHKLEFKPDSIIADVEAAKQQGFSEGEFFVLNTTFDNYKYVADKTRYAKSIGLTPAQANVFFDVSNTRWGEWYY